MPLITTSVPNLVQGVSQQPDNLRYPGQAESQINGYSTVVDGLAKRPNSRLIAKIKATAINSDALVHFVNRDASNQHVAIFDDGGGSTVSVSIFNVSAGTSIPATVTSAATSYLSTTNPLRNIRALTVADYTFLTNKAVKPAIIAGSAVDWVTSTSYASGDAVTYDGEYYKAKSGHTSSSDSEPGRGGSWGTYWEVHPDVSRPLEHDALIFVKQGDYDKKYTVTVDDQPFTITSGSAGSSGGTGAAAAADSETIATSLAGAFSTTGKYVNAVTVTDGGSGLGSLSGGVFVGFSGGGGTGAAGYVTVSSGAVTAVTITNGGSGYTTAPSVVFYDGLVNYLFGTPTTAATATATVATGSSLTVNRKGSVIKLSADSAMDLYTSDGLANTGLGLVYKEVESITDLPKKAFNDFRVKVRGDVELSQDDYYVKFATKDGGSFGEGAWVEDVGHGIPKALDTSTMPLTMVPTLNASGVITSYAVDVADWTGRVSGDADTNGDPSIVGSTINDMFFFKNRLGLVTDGAVIFSESDKYFNFFRTSVLSLLDGDPIDVGVSHTKTSILKHAIPFQEKLVLFSPQSQFVLRGTDLLTPKTVNISPITEYDVNEDVTPLALSNYIYFPFKRGRYDGIYEFFVDKDTDVFDASEITAQTPRYLPSDMRSLVGTPSEDVIVASTDDNLKHLYVYKYFWQNKEKIQSAWSRFDFALDVVGMGFMESDLYVVTTESGSNGGTYLEKVPMEVGLKDTDTGGNPLTYVMHLDRRLVGASITRIRRDASSATDLTTDITGLPFDPDGAVVYTSQGGRYVTTRVSDSACSVDEDLTTFTDWWLGFEYDMTYEFSAQTLKQPTERGGKSASNFTYQTLRNGAVDYADTGHFKIEVTPKYRDTYVYAFNPSNLGADSLIGSLVLESGSFRFPIHTKHDDATIKITSSSAFPLKILAAEFESSVTPRSKRYGG